MGPMGPGGIMGGPAEAITPQIRELLGRVCNTLKQTRQ